MSTSTQIRSLLRLCQTLLVTALLATLALPSWGQPRPTFQVNTQTQGIQNAPAVATQSTGEVFVVWEFGGARRFAADGTPLDLTEFALGQGTTVEEPDIAMNDQGSAVVVWQDDEIFGQRFTFDDSVPPSNEFIVNTSLGGVQRHASVDMDASGAFIVVYQSQSVDTSPQAIAMQRFNASGMPDGGETVVSTVDDSQLDSVPQVAIDQSSGRFAVAWESADGFVDVYVRLFAANGIPSTDPIFLDDGSEPDLAFSSTGTLLVTYRSGGVLQGDIFDSTGQQVGIQLPLVTGEASGRDARVTALDSGEFQLTWSRSNPSNPNEEDIFSRRIAADGTPSGDAFRVHQTTEGTQKLPDIDAIGNDIVIVFNDPDDDQAGISATCFEPDGCVNVFMDGFESGDTASWSDALP